MKAYYSLIQYTPDHGRMETANIGILLYTQTTPHIHIKIDTTYTQATKAFTNHNLHTHTTTLKNLQHQLNKTIKTKEELEHHIATRANQITYTPLRYCRQTTNPKHTIKKLYQDLVHTTPTIIQTETAKIINITNTHITHITHKNNHITNTPYTPNQHTKKLKKGDQITITTTITTNTTTNSSQTTK